MAGDWIKMREALFEDPAVLQMAAKLETRPEHIVGYCHRFWGWASRNIYVDDVTENCDGCHEASVTGVTLESVEAVLHLPGFLSLLCDVGWLTYDDTGEDPVIVVPKFDRHLSEGAKERVLTAERQRKSRAKKASQKPVTREDKNREEETPTGSLRKEDRCSPSGTAARFRSDEEAHAKAVEVAKGVADRLGLPSPVPKQDREFIVGVALLAGGALPEAWLHDAVDTTVKGKPRKPLGYFRKVLQKTATEHGEDLERLLRNGGE